MRPWVKVPVDLVVLVERLPRVVRGTFYGCFLLARRTDPHRGYLLSPTLRPYTIRDLAEELHTPRSTLRDDVDYLIGHGDLFRDFAGWLYMPLVIETERRLNARTTTMTPTSAPTTSGENGDASRDQQVALPMAGVPPGRETAENSDTHSLVFSSAEERRYVPSIEDGVENLVPDGIVLLADVVAELPPSIVSPDVRYLLAKLRISWPAWRDFPRSATDLALLERLEAIALGPLISALEQETLYGSAKKPGAWLSRTVPAIAMGREVAS